MAYELCLEPDTNIQVWDSLSEEWDHWSNWIYVSPSGDGLTHFAQADGITYLVPTCDIYELS